MAAGLPQFLLGKNITVQITPQDVSAGGVYSNNAIGTLTLKAVIEEDEFEQTLTTQNLASVSSFNANPVPVEYDATYSITELMGANPLFTSSSQVWGRSNYLEVCISKSWYHYVTVTAAANVSGTAVRTWSFYALMTGLKRSSPKAKNLNTATFKLISVGDGIGGFIANPAMS